MDKGTEFFIGCGFWGSILASNVSVRTQIQTHSVSSFVNTKKCINEESIEHLINNTPDLKSFKRIVVFTDVISSGDTLICIKKEVERLTGKKYEWLAVSILTDPNNMSKDFQNDFKICGALCTKVKMPVIERTLLPDDDIYPPQMDLTN